jgi:hypothetical protein
MKYVTYDVKNSVVGVAGELVLCGVTDKTLLFGESDPGGSDTVTCKGHLSVICSNTSMSSKRTLVVDHNLDLSALHDTNTRVGCSKIDTNNGSSDSIAIVLEGCLLLSVSCLSQHQASDKNHEKVESNAPCGALAGAP